MEWWQAVLIVFGSVVCVTFLLMDWCLCRAASLADEDDEL